MKSLEPGEPGKAHDAQAGRNGACSDAQNGASKQYLR